MKNAKSTFERPTRICDPTRPRGFYPRLDAVVVYALAVERMTGKQTALPAASAQWPAADYTKSLGAVAPREP